MTSPAMFDWNDLKYFLAVARHGSTIAAAKALGLSQSTIHRRVCELESHIGRQLMTRHPTGYRLTDFGKEMLIQQSRVGIKIREVKIPSSNSQALGHREILHKGQHRL